MVLAGPLIELEDLVLNLPTQDLRGKLFVETCVLQSHPKSVLLKVFGGQPDIDILCTNPMGGPSLRDGGGRGVDDDDSYSDATSLSNSWDGLPVVYEKVRIHNVPRCEKFLQIFSDALCPMVEMSADQHNAPVADAEFVAYLTGRLLSDKPLLPPAPVVSKEYAALCHVADMTAGIHLMFSLECPSTTMTVLVII